MKLAYPAATLALLLAAAPAQAQTATGADDPVDPAAYSGLWYEIARTPAPFQEQCDGGVTARYELIDAETVEVVNRCDLPDGGFESIAGTADLVDGDIRTLDVEFPGTPDDAGINYVIEAVGPHENGRYAWAAVIGGDGDMAWILSRTPELDDDARTEAEAALEDAGIDLDDLQETDQPPQNYEP